jgi:hypothetical protein
MVATPEYPEYPEVRNNLAVSISMLALISIFLGVMAMTYLNANAQG